MRRSKAVMLPMLLVPTLLLVVLPSVIGLAAVSQDNFSVERFLDSLPGNLARPILELPEREQLVVLVNGYLLAPLFLIVPLMVSAVLAADAFAGEKERRTIGVLLHLPISDRELFLAKLLVAFVPAVAGLVDRLRRVRRRGQRRRVAGHAPRVRPDQALDRDDLLGRHRRSPRSGWR